MERLIHVAAAVIRNATGKVLIAKRAADQHQGGLWEFPGGKVEANEPVVDALARELEEELGIIPQDVEPLIQIQHHYPDKSVLLDVFEVTHFSGTAWGKEGQPIQWVKNSELENYSFPAANKPIVSACQLPKTIAITPADIKGFAQLDDFLDLAFNRSAGAVMLRLPECAQSEIEALLRSAEAFCTEKGMFFSANVSVEMGSHLSLQSVHLNAKRLRELTDRSEFSGRWLSASCHSAEELEIAVAKGLDFVTLSPVLPTGSHPTVKPIGWEGFQALVKDCPIPVFALGGLSLGQQNDARELGAQGIAAISAWLN